MLASNEANGASETKSLLPTRSREQQFKRKDSTGVLSFSLLTPLVITDLD